MMVSKLSERIPEKYRFSGEDKLEIRRLLKKVFKIMLIVILIKCLRLYIRTNETTKATINEFISIVPLEQIIKVQAGMSITLATIGVVICYLIYGSKILRKKIFVFMFFFLILDMISLYVFPEISANVLRAIFLL